MGFFDTTPSACFIDDLLNFNIDETLNSFTTNSKATLLPLPSVFTECEDEEELEWLSNEDAFPSVDTFVPCVEPFGDIMSFESSMTTLKHESPVSVLENSSSFSSSNSNSNNSSVVITSCCSGRGLAPPIRRPRSKTSRRRLQGGFVNVPSQQWFTLCSGFDVNKQRNHSVKVSETAGVIGRKCTHCMSEKTPQWRAGPDGPKTLCNACGVRYKSGRLCPEYRPANSPTFSSLLHSTSHRKIVEMRKMKQVRNMKGNSVDSH